MTKILIVVCIILSLCISCTDKQEDTTATKEQMKETRQKAGNVTTLIDHAEVLQNLNKNTLQQGKKLYNQACAACHGTDGTSQLAAARSFNSDEFKYGSDPYSMWKTITNGAGQMGAQRWLSPKQRYYVVQYIREELIKGENLQAYFEITDEYLEGLPETVMSPENLRQKIKREALSGSQEYGQQYFSENLGNYGPAIYSQLRDSVSKDMAVEHNPNAYNMDKWVDRVSNAITIKLADGIYLSYNVHRMSTAAAWVGSLDLSETKFQKYRGEGSAAIGGRELAGIDRMRWSFQDRYSQLDKLVSKWTPFPRRWLDYHGHYQNGKKVILSYSIIGRKVLELPSVEMLNGTPVIQHTFTIAPGNTWRKIMLGGLGDRASEAIKEGVFSLDNPNATEGLSEENWGNPHESLVVTVADKGSAIEDFFAAGVQGDTEGMRWVLDEPHHAGLYIPPSDEEQTITIHRFSGQGQAQYIAFVGFLSDTQNRDVTSPKNLTKGGERVWKETVVTKGQLNVGRPHYDPVHYGEANHDAPENLVAILEYYPYTVDRITLPFDNPWKSWIRPTAFDFYEDGRLVMSTYLGDVWIAEGIDKNLEEIRWRRIATGLYDPLGLKIVDGQIFVNCRDRLVRLKDLNGDGETDFYESFFADIDVSDESIQAYNYSLETDSRGNFIFSDDEPGQVIRVTPDGQSRESVAIGFRAPNGVTVGHDDRIFVSDNQGNWTPANKINLVKEGGFYGYLPTISPYVPKLYLTRPDKAAENYPKTVLPDSFRQPIIWLPQEFDNSPGEGAWTPEEWGPLGGELLWTSYGKGWVYHVLIDQVGKINQAAASALPFQFDSGIQRARINPTDGQYYVAGVTGWDDSFAEKYGSLNRIRYTGGEGFVMGAVKVRSNGIAITFNQKLDAEVATQASNYMIKQWNYRWKERYGSEDWSVKNPDQTGRDDVPVQGVELSSDGKTILIQIPDQDLQPVDQMRIQLRLASEDGKQYKDTIYLTIHKVAGREDLQN